MKVLVATDAWHPQVNGVVRTLGSLARAAGEARYTDRIFCRRKAFPHFSCRLIPGCGSQCRAGAESPSASKRRSPTPSISQPKGRSVSPCALIAAGTDGRSRPAIRRGFRNTFRPERQFRRSWIYAALRWFHAGATVTMVATPSLMSELAQRGFAHLGMWTRGVDVDLFRPDRAIDLGFERPIFMTVGRVAVEKNLEAFLSLDLPGTKVVIGTGPQEGEAQAPISRRQISRSAGKRNARRAFGGGGRFCLSEPHRHIRHRSARSAGERRSGRRFPVTGPKDVIGDKPIGVLDEDLGRACMERFAAVPRRLPQIRARLFLGK